MTVNPVRVLPFSLLAVIACSGGSNPHVTTCTTAGDTVTLAAWQYASIDPAGGNGCTVYPAPGGSGAQYLLVPQITTGPPGRATEGTPAGRRHARAGRGRPRSRRCANQPGAAVS